MSYGGLYSRWQDQYGSSSTKLTDSGAVRSLSDDLASKLDLETISSRSIELASEIWRSPHLRRLILSFGDLSTLGRLVRLSRESFQDVVNTLYWETWLDAFEVNDSRMCDVGRLQNYRGAVRHLHALRVEPIGQHKPRVLLQTFPNLSVLFLTPGRYIRAPWDSPDRPAWIWRHRAYNNDSFTDEADLVPLPIGWRLPWDTTYEICIDIHEEEDMSDDASEAWRRIFADDSVYIKPPLFDHHVYEIGLETRLDLHMVIRLLGRMRIERLRTLWIDLTSIDIEGIRSLHQALSRCCKMPDVHLVINCHQSGLNFCDMNEVLALFAEMTFILTISVTFPVDHIGNCPFNCSSHKDHTHTSQERDRVEAPSQGRWRPRPIASTLDELNLRISAQHEPDCTCDTPRVRTPDPRAFAELLRDRCPSLVELHCNWMGEDCEGETLWDLMDDFQHRVLDELTSLYAPTCSEDAGSIGWWRAKMST